MHEQVFPALEAAWLTLSMLACPVLFLLQGSYGRHTSTGFGPGVPHRLATGLIWIPNVAAMVACFAHSQAPRLAWALAGVWLAYHLLLLPTRLLIPGKPMALSSLTGYLIASCINTYLNGHWLAAAASTGTPYGWPYTDAYVQEPFLWLGALLFIPGALITLQSDAILVRLRRGAERSGSFRIPSGGLFSWVSCPNYLGEMLAAAGWALGTWSVPGTAFALWTAAQLLPKAHAHHRWYLRNFADYPRNRRALLPGLF